MTKIIRAEFLKAKRTMSSKLIFAFPIIALVMAFVLTAGMTNAYAESAWNWWYVFLLPGMIAIISYLTVIREKKNGYYNIKTLPIEKKDLMLGKIIYLGILVLVSNAVLFAGATLGGIFLTTSVPVVGAAITVIVLTIAQLWQIPLYLFLSDKFGMVVEIIVCLSLTVLGVSVAPSEKWFLLVSAISTRVVTPLLHVLPNGMRAQAGDSLLSSSVIFPGIIIALAHFLLLTYLYLNWFEKREVK